MQAGTDPWQDEDTRTFYTSLPDLKVFMPNYQMKEVNFKLQICDFFFMHSKKSIFFYL